MRGAEGGRYLQRGQHCEGSATGEADQVVGDGEAELGGIYLAPPPGVRPGVLAAHVEAPIGQQDLNTGQAPSKAERSEYVHPTTQHT